MSHRPFLAARESMIPNIFICLNKTMGSNEQNQESVTKI